MRPGAERHGFLDLVLVEQVENLLAEGFGVDGDEPDPEVLPKRLPDARRLALAEETVVHEDAGELVPDGAVDKRGALTGDQESQL